jgi:hypothetical protein
MVIIILQLLFLSSQLISPLFTPEPLELEIPAKYLDYKPKVLDLPDPIEPKPNTPRKQFTSWFLGYTIY